MSDQPAGPAGTDVTALEGRPQVVVRDDLERSRLTVFFRLLLAIPHLLVLGVWSLISLFMAMINWVSILFTGRTVGGDLQVRYLRYFTHVDAYLNLAANPFPGFGGDPGYPVDLEVEEMRTQSRWKTAFRLPLALPAILLVSAFGASVQAGGGGARVSFGIVAVAGFLGWFACMARGSMPRGLRDLAVYGISYSAQVGAYLLLVTDRYPNSDPLAVRYPDSAPDHPIRVTSTDDLRRSRLSVFFRLPLWLPHLVWLVLWGVVALLSVVLNWLVTLLAGRPARSLHSFYARYLRYLVHTNAFLYLVANPFPGFTGRPGTYPVDLAIAPPDAQSRWKTGFRLVLALPAMFVAGALSNALYFVAVFGWFVGLFRGRMPEGLQRLGVFALRYSAQLGAYAGLLTDQYPYSGPSQELLPTVAPQAASA